MRQKSNYLAFGVRGQGQLTFMGLTFIISPWEWDKKVWRRFICEPICPLLFLLPSLKFICTIVKCNYQVQVAFLVLLVVVHLGLVLLTPTFLAGTNTYDQRSREYYHVTMMVISDVLWVGHTLPRLQPNQLQRQQWFLY